MKDNYMKLHHLTTLKLSNAEAGLEIMLFVKSVEKWEFVLKKEFTADDLDGIVLPRAHSGKMVKIVISKSPSASFCSPVKLHGCPARGRYKHLPLLNLNMATKQFPILMKGLVTNCCL